jgi:peptide/nickel transport system permease protein
MNPSDSADERDGRDGQARDGPATVRTDGSGERAAAFKAGTDYSMGRADRIREIYDKKFYAPLRILMSDYRGIFGVSILMMYLLMGTVGVVLIPEPSQAGPSLLPPFQDLQFPLGTGPSGKGLFRMVVHATPRMLKLMAGGVVFSTALGVGVGTVAGYKRGTIDRVLMTVADTALNLPGLPLLLVLVAILQPSDPFVIGVVLSINAWAGAARSLRSQVLQLRKESYTEASRAMGASTSQNIQRNILPNLLPLITIGVMSSLRSIVFSAVGLYFLGVLPINFLNWGVMLNMSYQSINLATMTNIHYLLVPLVTISLFGMGATFMAQAFDRVFNPRLRAKYARTIVGGDGDDANEASDASKEVMLQ